MSASISTRSVGQIVVDTIVAHGVRRAFCVPGESYLGILEAVREAGDGFDLVVCRHEGGAAYMAEAAGRLSGRPGICMVTRGPGACNAAIGIHTAQHEGTPLVLLVGDVTSGTKGRAAFQDIDLQAFYGKMAKRVFQVEHARDTATVLRQAFRVALSGKPGPVVVGFPEDVQFEQLPSSGGAPTRVEDMAPDPRVIATLLARLAAAKRPLLLVGGTKWSDAARADLAAFASKLQLPVACTFRRQDLIDHTHQSYVGSIGVVTPPALAQYMVASDFVLLLGGQLGEIETARYSRMVEPDPGRFFVHAAPFVEDLGLALRPDLAICTDMGPICEALAAAPLLLPEPTWAAAVPQLRKAYDAYRRPVRFEGRANPGVGVEQLAAVLPRDTIVTIGAGNYTHFVLRHHPLYVANSLLAPICAPMGYSVPAAIAAAMQAPGREVVAYAGDGCFLMNAQELVTAAHRNLQLTVIVVNNGIYGSIRMHQEMKYPGRPVATDLHNPDFVAYAQSMGITARRIDGPHQLAQAWTAMRGSVDGPILIEMPTDPDIMNTEKVVPRTRPATGTAA